MKPEEGSRSFVVVEGNQRVDRAVCDHFDVGRRKARQWLECGMVRVDGRRAKAGERVAAGAVVVVAEVAAGVSITPAREGEQPRIAWAEGALIVVAKPPGFHSVRGKEGPSIAEYLASRFPGIESVGADGECGLVHRLDRDTSGALLATSDPDRHKMLREAFAAGKVRKRYLALVHGPVTGKFDVDQPLAREYTKVRLARSWEFGRRAETRVRPLEGGLDWTLVHCEMSTGVTHQIRAHLAYAGHPIIGDSKYGDSDEAARYPAGQLLHAFSIRVDAGCAVAVAAAGIFLATLARLRARSTRGA